MDYEPYDSSGTDDDLPPSHRVARGGRPTGNGRPSTIPQSYSKVYDDADMESQIHQIEKEAYISILRAFKAQADAITWEKESLITELRKELRLSNEEHRELLVHVNGDDTIRRIREWRQFRGSDLCDTIQPSPSVSASIMKQMQNQTMPGPAQAGPKNHLPSSSSKRGSIPNAKGKKHTPALPHSSSTKSLTYDHSDNGRRGQMLKRIPSIAASSGEPMEAMTPESLVGRRVRTRWPEDNTFYEAVITEYNRVEGLHALVYDIGTGNETWEWVNLLEISPRDILWVGEDPNVAHLFNYNGRGHVPNTTTGPSNVLERKKDFPKNPIRKDFRTSLNGIGKKTSRDIRIRHTDVLIREVERIFNSNNPDPHEVERARKVLKEQEHALEDAIAGLADISDGESAL